MLFLEPTKCFAEKIIPIRLDVFFTISLVDYWKCTTFAGRI